MPEFSTEQQGADTIYAMNSEKAVFRMDTPEYGAFCFETATGLKAESIFASFGDFSESLALHDRRKPHVVADGEELTLDAVNPIPFGAEPKIKREFKFDGDTLAVSTTFLLRHNFEMRSIFAGGLRFSGSIASVGIVSVPEQAGPVPELKKWTDLAALTDGAELFSADCPPLKLVLKAEDGSSLEFQLGENIWRWVNAKRIDGTCKYVVMKRGNSLEFTWQLYTFVPTSITNENGEMQQSLPPPGRDWRIRCRLIRHDAAKRKKPSMAKKCKEIFDMAAYPWPENALVSDGGKDVCFVSAAALNTLKKWIRKQFAEAQDGDIFGIANTTANVCYSAAHVDRPKLDSLPHWDKPALDDFAKWANRQLAKYGAKLVIL